MVYRIVAIPMTLRSVQGHSYSATAILFKCYISYSYVAAE